MTIRFPSNFIPPDKPTDPLYRLELTNFKLNGEPSEILNKILDLLEINQYIIKNIDFNQGIISSIIFNKCNVFNAVFRLYKTEDNYILEVHRMAGDPVEFHIFYNDIINLFKDNLFDPSILREKYDFFSDPPDDDNESIKLSPKIKNEYRNIYIQDINNELSKMRLSSEEYQTVFNKMLEHLPESLK